MPIESKSIYIVSWGTVSSAQIGIWATLAELLEGGKFLIDSYQSLHYSLLRFSTSDSFPGSNCKDKKKEVIVVLMLFTY